VHGDLVTAGDAAGHEAGLGEGGGAIVHAGVGDVHAEELAGHGLEFEHRLQGALADLRLVGRVGGVVLAAADDVGDGAGDEVPVSAAAQEAGSPVAGDAVLVRQVRQLAREVELAGRGRQVEAVDAELRGDVREQLVDAGDADGLEHGAAVFVGVRDVGVRARRHYSAVSRNFS
jgi:hypothetical protein